MTRNMLAAALVALGVAAPGAAPAETFAVPVMGRINENATPEIVGPVAVRLNDQSYDSCWTNLREVREYAEEKLVGEGFELTDNGADNFTLAIGVLSNRRDTLFGQGSCQGLVNVSLGTSFRRSDGLRGNFVVAEMLMPVPEAEGMNEVVNSAVGMFFEQYRERVR